VSTRVRHLIGCVDPSVSIARSRCILGRPIACLKDLTLSFACYTLAVNMDQAELLSIHVRGGSDLLQCDTWCILLALFNKNLSTTRQFEY
jgi:hypothetical protein